MHALADFDKVIKYENYNVSAYLSNFKNYKEPKKEFEMRLN